MDYVAESLEIIGTPAGTDVLMTFDLSAAHADPSPGDIGDAW